LFENKLAKLVSITALLSSCGCSL